MLTLLLDETGRGIGRGDATNVPGYIPGKNEIACSPEQYEDPGAWMRVGDALVSATAIPASPDALLTYARAVRYEAEIAGAATTYGPVATDDRSKILILGSLMAAQADPTWTSPWQFADGTTAVVDRTAIVAMSAAVQAHVNAAFAVFGIVQAGITAVPATITTRADVDAAFTGLRG